MQWTAFFESPASNRDQPATFTDLSATNREPSTTFAVLPTAKLMASTTSGQAVPGETRPIDDEMSSIDGATQAHPAATGRTREAGTAVFVGWQSLG